MELNAILPLGRLSVIDRPFRQINDFYLITISKQKENCVNNQTCRLDNVDLLLPVLALDYGCLGAGREASCLGHGLSGRRNGHRLGGKLNHGSRRCGNSELPDS